MVKIKQIKVNEFQRHNKHKGISKADISSCCITVIAACEWSLKHLLFPLHWYSSVIDYLWLSTLMICSSGHQYSVALILQRSIIMIMIIIGDFENKVEFNNVNITRESLFSWNIVRFNTDSSLSILLSEIFRIKPVTHKSAKLTTESVLHWNNHLLMSIKVQRTAVSLSFDWDTNLIKLICYRHHFILKANCFLQISIFFHVFSTLYFSQHIMTRSYFFSKI